MSGGIRVTVHHGRVPSAPFALPPARPPQAPGAVATLREGDAIAGVYACTRKDRLVARTGSSYLALELRDRTGTLPGRLFRDADQHAARFERGDLVTVAGRVTRFRGELQAELTSVARAAPGAADPAAFLPVAYRDVDELEGFLDALAGEVRQPQLRALLQRLLDDEPARAALVRSPATRAQHHAYLGGLLEHTVAVATLAVETCALHQRLDQDLLLTAALIHDLGRTRELSLGAEIGLTDEGRLLGHVELGLRMLGEAAAQTGIDDARHLALAHCVLGHHGPDALPQRRYVLPEAVALARINALDAAVKGAVEHGVGLDVAGPGA
jgi:3'-5' exoribonuclease